MSRAWLLAPALLATALAGCIATPAAIEPQSSAGSLLDPLWDTTGNYSRVLAPGPFRILEPEVLDFDSGAGITINSAVVRPDVPEGTRVPVVLELSPYFGGDVADVNGWQRQALVENLVPHGYAFAQVAVRGTSGSGGCQEVFGPNELQDFVGVLDHYASQPWSNGNLAAIGLSYPGTTPWMAAALGHPALKAIVPISGLTDLAENTYRNGTAERRSFFVHLIYWGSIGFGDDLATQQVPADNLCEEGIEAVAAWPAAALTGETATGPLAGYWADRRWREAVLENYRGAVYLVHGLQDWNVQPTMAFPFVTRLQAEGRDVKMLLGQWQHDFPDRAAREAHVRWDFAEGLRAFLDRHLKGLDVDAGPAVWVEDSRGLWRTEATWPPADAAPATWELGDRVLSMEPTPAGGSLGLSPLGANQALGSLETLPTGSAATNEWTFLTEPLTEELRFSGMAQLHVTAVPHGHGGRLYAELLDAGHGNLRVRVAHAAMDLRFHAGGTEPQSLTPGEPVLALMEMYPADVVVAAGHRLVLRIVPEVPYAEPHLQGAPAPIELRWGEGASVLRLPVVARDVGDGRYPGQPVLG